MQTKERLILISGGSSGLGAACAIHFASQGAKILILDVNEPGESLASYSSQICFAKTNVTQASDVEQAIEKGTVAFGPLSGAILCAGILHSEKIVGREGAASLDAFRRVIEVNLIGSFSVARLAALSMSNNEPDEEGERGVIVMTSSVAAEDGQIGQCSYAASKGGVASMTLPMARDLSRNGIRVVSIAPGVFETPMMGVAPDKIRDSLIGQTPFPNRFGRPEEFAAMAQHIFENRMLNGCTIRVDAGLRMPFR